MEVLTNIEKVALARSQAARKVTVSAINSEYPALISANVLVVLTAKRKRDMIQIKRLAIRVVTRGHLLLMLLITIL